jgi:NADPH-dependent 2,4-dienoyl-CoA reductase/sulfur reductase-like enzyme/nitrite reductase/ring-hydroxylating ferredoxin subunit
VADAQKPKLSDGIRFQDLADGAMIQGRVGDEDVLLGRSGEAFFAVSAYCTHWHGSLGEGLLVGNTLRCPLHHACFDIHTGEALHAPALDAIARWRVERAGDTIFVREKLAAAKRSSSPLPGMPRSTVIVGGGAAGLAAALTLRREGYEGTLFLISADDSAPYDRPNLSKDFLAGSAPEDWIPLRVPQFYGEYHIELMLNTRVLSIDTVGGRLILQSGRVLDFDALLLATGAEPVRLSIPGSIADQMYYLRTFTDARAIAARAAGARRVIVVGASFIGLEVAAALRTRGIAVHVVDRERVPMVRVLGEQVGRFLQGLHESHGVEFHLGNSIEHMEGRQARLSDATKLDADFVVVGVGVKPNLALAEQAGLMLDRGLVVNEYLETSAPGVFAAGDIARWPDPHSGERIRVEHWVVAERQGQVAARNILGYHQKFQAAPFFWSQHYDLAINYVGHAESWDSVEIEGELDSRNCTIKYKRAERALAVATIGRDRDSLCAELAMEVTA